MNEKKTKTFIFESYAAIFNTVDRNNELIIHDAFNIDEYSNELKIFYNHDTDMAIGKILKINQDSKGLYVKFEITENALNKNILDLMISQLTLSMSIGYIINESFTENGIQYLLKLDLLEISVVNLPVNKLAKIFSIREKEENQNTLLYLDQDLGVSEE